MESVEVRFPTGLLWVNGVLFIVFGVCFAAAPAFFAEALTGAAPGTPSALIDMRATYGGTAIGAGLFFGFCACQPGSVRLGLLASLFLLGGIAGARIVGFVVDGSPNLFMPLLLGAELLFVALIMGALRQTGREESPDGTVAPRTGRAFD